MLIKFLDEWPEPKFVSWVEDEQNPDNFLYYTKISDTKEDGTIFRLKLSFSAKTIDDLKDILSESLLDKNFSCRLKANGFTKIGAVVFKKMKNGLDFPVLLFVYDSEEPDIYLVFREIGKYFSRKVKRAFTKR